MPVHHGEVLLDQVVQHRVVAERVFQDEAGADAAARCSPAAKAGAPDQRCGARRRLKAQAIAAMRIALGHAAGDGEVGLQHVRGAQLRQLAEVVAGELALAGC